MWRAGRIIAKGRPSGLTCAQPDGPARVFNLADVGVAHRLARCVRREIERSIVIILDTPRLALRHLSQAISMRCLLCTCIPRSGATFQTVRRTLEETKRELEWFQHGHPEFPRLGLWATVERSSGAFLGRCGLLPWKIDGKLEVELAFLIAKARWGEGLATEAAFAIAN